MKTTSQAMVNLIKTFEGYRANAYRCPAGVWTIGYGTTRINGNPVKAGDVCDPVLAESYLRADLASFEKEVNAMPNVDNLMQKQFDALICFAYNVGTANFKRSTLRRKVIANPYDHTIAKEFCKWKYATVNGEKKVLAGLLRRRATEAAWYTFGVEWSNRVKDVIAWAQS